MFANDWEKAWDIYKHSDAVYHNRISFFLIAESMLLVSFSTLFVSNIDSIIPMAICIIGIAYSFTWFYVNKRIETRLGLLTDRYLLPDPVYYMYIKRIEKTKLAPVSVFLPWVTAFTWMFFLDYLIVKIYPLAFSILLCIALSLLFIFSTLAVTAKSRAISINHKVQLGVIVLVVITIITAIFTLIVCKVD